MASTYIATGENKSSKQKTLIARIFSYAFLIFVSFLALFPFYIMIINSTRTGNDIAASFELIPGGAFIDNFSAAWSDPNMVLWKGLLNSFIVAITSSVLTVYFSAMTAYGIHVYNFKGKNFAFKFILLIMTIPTQISAVGFVAIMGQIGLQNNFLPLIIPSIAAPSVFFYMKQYMDSTLPLEVIEAARVDGSNEFRTFNTIALPMMKPAMAVQLIFAFTASWNNYFTPALLLKDSKLHTLPIMINTLRGNIGSGNTTALGRIYMTMFIAILPVIIVYVCVSKHIVQGVALGAVKG